MPLDHAGRNKMRRAKAVKMREHIAEVAAASHRIIQFDNTRRVAIYARWSNFIQIDRHLQSLEDQTAGQKKQAIEKGRQEDQIDIYTADADYSGTVDIDDFDPEGLPALLATIKKGIYGVVFSWMEDRLFRDDYLDNATRFARACGENKCYHFNKSTCN